MENKKIFLAYFGLTILISLALYSGVNIFKKQPQQAKKETAQLAVLPVLDQKKVWGEPVKTMFPDITNPKYVDAKAAGQFVKDEDDVLVLNVKNNTYVYPISIMSFHHIVNDTIDKEPVVITYCLLADAAVAFRRSLDGKTLELGVLGPLYSGDLIMYDKKNDSYILQVTGQMFKGANKGKILTQYTSLERKKWKEVKGQKNLQILPPVQKMAFYRDFFEKRKNATVGINSLTTKGIPLDPRLPELTKGIGIVNEDSVSFVALDKVDQNRDKIQASQLSTQVYWYVWSGLYPQTTVL